jgi:predicted signal transduction protein with EAL and GGDEF domain
MRASKASHLHHIGTAPNGIDTDGPGFDAIIRWLTNASRSATMPAICCVLSRRRRINPRNHDIYAAQIKAVYRHLPMILAVNIINSALVAVVLASYLNQSRWWIFFGLVATLTAARAAGWSCYRRDQGPGQSPVRWAFFATAGSALSGLLWGLSSTLMLSDNIVEQTFFAFGSAPAAAPRRRRRI